MLELAEDITEAVLTFFGDINGIGNVLDSVDVQTYDNIEKNLTTVINNTLEEHKFRTM